MCCWYWSLYLWFRMCLTASCYHLSNQFTTNKCFMIFLIAGSEVAIYCALHFADVLKETDEYKSGHLEKALSNTFMEIDRKLKEPAAIRVKRFIHFVEFLHVAALAIFCKVDWSKSAMSNPNGLLRQKLCHYLNQGRKLNDMLMRGRRPHIEWLNLILAN